MSVVLQGLGAFFLSMVLAVFAQNAVLSRALGVSRLVKLVMDGENFARFAGLLTLVQLLCVPMAYYANGLLAHFAQRSAVRPLVMVLAAGASMGIVWLGFSKLVKAPWVPEMLSALPLATFNCAVLGALLVTVTQSYTLLQSFGFALGSGIGYAGALAVVGQAQERLNNSEIPASFRGLPITLVYLGILALAIYGFTGHMVVI